MKFPLSIPATLLLLTVIYSCNQGNTSERKEERKTLSLQNIDSAVKPGEDFYMFANGKWYDTATILPTEFRAGARLEMDFITKDHIKSVLQEAAAADSPKSSIGQKVGDFFASGMDTAVIEKAGLNPIRIFLKQIDSIRDVSSLMEFVATQTTCSDPLLISQYVGPDEKNSAINILVFTQAGLGLPDRDYYFKTDSATRTVVKSYQNYVKRLFILTGDDSVQAVHHAATVYYLEKQMAQSHRTNVELRNPQLNYNKVSVSYLDKKMPDIRWQNLLTGLHVKTDSVNLAQPGYYTTLNGLLKTIPIEDWKTYLRFHLTDYYSSYLSGPFVQANFDYYEKTLNGQQQMKPRWENVYGVIDAFMGEALGQLYVKKYFSEDAKKRITELVNNLQRAFETRISKVDWMSDSTKQKAKDKLASFGKKVAFPDHWKDYSKVTISRQDYAGNVIACGINEYNRSATKVGRPVDKSEWGMTPPTNNAYYNPYYNEIVFPAGILQYPMFDPAADDAMNYGGIGVVIGHEFTHGFDDQGAQYDKDGNLKNWWGKDDYTKFKGRGKQIVDLYNGFVVLDSVHVNGSLTQGENTADFGGVAIAYDAFKMTKEGQDTTRIDGFTPDQRFFLSFAQTWRKKLTEEALRQQINTDPHSPGNYRIKGPLMNFTPFYSAFNVQPGEKMYRADSARIKIW
jgi:putative endopeptidase